MKGVVDGAGANGKDDERPVRANEGPGGGADGAVNKGPGGAAGGAVNDGPAAEA